MLNAAQAAAKWLRNSQAAGPNIVAAINAMQDADNPMAKAAQAEAQWIAGCQRANTTRKFSTNVGQVTFQEWKRAMLDKGVPNYQNGLARGSQKMAFFLQSFLPFLQGAKANLPPRGTLQQNIARMTMMVNQIAQFRGFMGQGGGAGPMMPGAGN